MPTLLHPYEAQTMLRNRVSYEVHCFVQVAIGDVHEEHPPIDLDV